MRKGPGASRCFLYNIEKVGSTNNAIMGTFAPINATSGSFGQMSRAKVRANGREAATRARNHLDTFTRAFPLE